jgi:hypothetical protein
MFSNQLSGQINSQMKLNLELGLLDLAEKKSIGLFLNIEPKINATKNIDIGLRIGAALNSQTIDNHDPVTFNIREDADNGTLSFIPTLDFNWEMSNKQFYAGTGLGLFMLGNPVELKVATNEVLEIPIDNRIGFMLRSGFKMTFIRVGLEYDFVPNADIIKSDGEEIGTVDLSYLGISLSYLFEGKKSKSRKRN